MRAHVKVFSAVLFMVCSCFADQVPTVTSFVPPAITNISLAQSAQYEVVKTDYFFGGCQGFYDYGSPCSGFGPFNPARSSGDLRISYFVSANPADSLILKDATLTISATQTLYNTVGLEDTEPYSSLLFYSTPASLSFTPVAGVTISSISAGLTQDNMNYTFDSQSFFPSTTIDLVDQHFDSTDLLSSFNTIDIGYLASLYLNPDGIAVAGGYNSISTYYLNSDYNVDLTAQLTLSYYDIAPPPTGGGGYGGGSGSGGGGGSSRSGGGSGPGPTPTPEPATLALISSGLVGLCGLSKRKRAPTSGCFPLKESFGAREK